MESLLIWEFGEEEKNTENLYIIDALDLSAQTDMTRLLTFDVCHLTFDIS